MYRRTFLFASSGAAAGSLLVPGFAEADDGDKSPYAGSGLISCDTSRVKVGSKRVNHKILPKKLHKAICNA